MDPLSILNRGKKNNQARLCVSPPFHARLKVVVPRTFLRKFARSSHERAETRTAEYQSCSPSVFLRDARSIREREFFRSQNSRGSLIYIYSGLPLTETVEPVSSFELILPRAPSSPFHQPALVFTSRFHLRPFSLSFSLAPGHSPSHSLGVPFLRVNQISVERTREKCQ